MRKMLTVAAVIAVAVLAVLPYANGVIMQQALSSVIDDYNALYPNRMAGYSLEMVAYERHYFTSNFEIKINMGSLEDFYGFESASVVMHATHRLLGVVATARIDHNPGFADFVDQRLNGRNPVSITTCFSLLSGFDTTAATNAFSIGIDGDTLDVKPGKLVFRTDRSLEKINITGNWGGLTDGETFTVGNTTMTSGFKRVADLVWEGEALIHVDRAEAIGNEAQLHAKNLEIAYGIEADQQSDAIGGDVLLTAESIRLKDREVKDASVRLAVNNVDLSAYKAFAERYFQITATMMPQLKSLNDAGDREPTDEAKQAMALYGIQMMTAWEQLLTEGLELMVSDFHVTLPEGDVAGDLTLRLLQDMTLARFAPLIYQPQMLTDIIHLQSHLTIPATVVGENPNLLTPLHPVMQTGVFVLEGDNLVHTAVTKDGMLLLNGMAVNLGG